MEGHTKFLQPTTEKGFMGNMNVGHKRGAINLPFRALFPDAPQVLIGPDKDLAIGEGRGPAGHFPQGIGGK